MLYVIKRHQIWNILSPESSKYTSNMCAMFFIVNYYILFLICCLILYTFCECYNYYLYFWENSADYFFGFVLISAWSPAGLRGSARRFQLLWIIWRTEPFRVRTAAEPPASGVRFEESRREENRFGSSEFPRNDLRSASARKPGSALVPVGSVHLSGMKVLAVIRKKSRQRKRGSERKLGA